MPHLERDLSHIPLQYRDAYHRFVSEYLDDNWWCWKIRFRHGKLVVIPFFTFYVKSYWSPVLARLEFYNNWLSFVITLVSAFGRANLSWSAYRIVSYIGAASLFIGQMIIHFWYGYLRYPNPARSFIAAANEEIQKDFDDSDEEFEATRDLLSVLYHGKEHNHTQEGVQVAAWFIKLVNNLAAIAIAVSVCVAIFVAYVGAAVYAEQGPQRDEECAWLLAVTFVVLLSQCLVECAFSASGVVAAVGGSLVWVALFLWVDFDRSGGRSAGFILKPCAMIMMFLLEESYTSLLFRKNFAEFAKTATLQVFYDIVGELEVIDSGGVPPPPTDAKPFKEQELKKQKERSGEASNSAHADEVKQNQGAAAAEGECCSSVEDDEAEV